MVNDTAISPPKICLTAAGCLVHQDKVLLVKHKKLGIWLNPGGHVEVDELPHITAEREFWEETGVAVRAVNQVKLPMTNDGSWYFPSPYLTNLHWISQENYQHRVHGTALSPTAQRKWSKGCEQHVSFIYLMQPQDPQRVEFSQNLEETDGIDWFKIEQLDKLETRDNVRIEVTSAFQLSAQLST